MFASRSSSLLGHLPLTRPPYSRFFLGLFFFFFTFLQISTATPLPAFITGGGPNSRYHLYFFFSLSEGNHRLGHGHGPLFKSKSQNAQTFSVLDSIL